LGDGDRDSNGKEKESPGERIQFIYAARYEKIDMKRYIMSQTEIYLWPSVTDGNCALDDINNYHIDINNCSHGKLTIETIFQTCRLFVKENSGIK